MTKSIGSHFDYNEGGGHGWDIGDLAFFDW